MQRRLGGAIPAEISSNNAAGGGVSGQDIGNILPGVLDSLQESAAATQTPKLYYDEKLGQYNYPSYQATYGVENSDFLNITKFGEQGDVWVEKDFLWRGPCVVKITVNIPTRYTAGVSSGNGEMDTYRFRPQLFYSYGAGYAATKLFEFNLGGAGTYKIDRYANFVGIMASCFSTCQRATLMKAAGSGVIANTVGLENFMGTAGSCASFVSGVRPNFAGDGTPLTDFHEQTQILSPFPSQISEDHWIVAVKTPHTSFNNPRIPRKPIDTNILSDNFNIRLETGSLIEFMDTGTGICPIFLSANTEPPFWMWNNSSVNPLQMFLENFRQYDNYYGSPVTPSGDTQHVHESYFSTSGKSIYQTTLTAHTVVDNSNKDQLFPTSAYLSTVGNSKPFPLETPEEINISIEHIVSSLRLTNSFLGAYNVLAGNTKMACYYPFSHLTSQAYYPENLPFKHLTLGNIIRSDYHESNLPTSEKTLIRQPINIPVNPLLAMYVLVYREKDRVNTFSKQGGYSPSLFWNSLLLPRFRVTYGSEVLIDYQTYGEKLVQDSYTRCSAVSIPYKGGACCKSEFLTAKSFSADYNPMLPACQQSSQGLYHAVDRLAHMYEISFCEQIPLLDEARLQQTPSFMGEQLDFHYIYDPILYTNGGGGVNSYDVASNVSYLDVYPNTKKGQAEITRLYNSRASDSCISVSTRDQQSYEDSRYQGYSVDEKGYGKEVNPWVLNNGNLMIQVVYAQNALWQMNPNMSKVVFSRG